MDLIQGGVPGLGVNLVPGGVPGPRGHVPGPRVGCTRSQGGCTWSGGEPGPRGVYLVPRLDVPGPRVGCTWSQGKCTWSQGVVPGQVLPPCGQTYACKLIILPQTSFVGGIKLTAAHMLIGSCST